MKFEQYQQIKAHALAACTAAGLTYGEPKQLNPILLAYIGDVVFSLYVRLRLLPTSGQVRVIHDLGSKMVSAVMQAKAMEALLSDLTELWERNQNMIEAKILKPGYTQKEALVLLFNTDPKLDLLDIDEVYYPYGIIYVSAVIFYEISWQ